MSDRGLRNVKYSMLLINIIAILFPAVFIYITTKHICNYFIARSYLNGVNAIPYQPEYLLFNTVLLASALVLSFILREFVFSQNIKFVYTSLFLDFMISVLLMFVLQFNYNGILFWVFANIIYHVHDKVKLIFMLLAIVIYCGTDYEFLIINYQLFSLSDYVNIYDANMQQYLIGGYNVLVSLNSIVFIIYCIYVIQAQQGIIEKVNSLYSQLTAKNEELKDANEELQQLANIKELMGKTKERNRLAREIHDTLGHTLTGISAGIDACITTIETNPQLTKKQLELISKVTRDGIGEVRRSVNELRPDALERLSLESAIRSMIDEMIQMSQAEVMFECSAENLKFDEDEENTIYRIIQESITNAIRHGNATKIWVTIKDVQSKLHIHIKDNGIGCKDMKNGFGTKHMMERISMLHGSITFSGEEGFEVKAVIPIRWGEQYD